jgi:hypothetical protein
LANSYLNELEAMLEKTKVATGKSDFTYFFRCSHPSWAEQEPEFFETFLLTKSMHYA